MTLDEISVSFTADISGFSAAVSQIGALITSASAQADTLASDFSSAGAKAGTGLQAGILSRKAAVVAAARAVAAAAAAALKEGLQIHSPSRVTYEVGAFFDQGLINGIAEGTGRVEKEASSLARTASAALQLPKVPSPVPVSSFAVPSPQAESAQNANLSITVPLEIDGYRLGVAAIEGINRVTGSTGRVELNL